MNKGIFFVFAILFFFGKLEANSAFKVIGYYPSWAIYRQQPLQPKEIDANLLTHINYAFVKVDTTGNLSLADPWADTDYGSDLNSAKPYKGNFLQLVQLKKRYPHLKTLFSVGGWTFSDSFSEMAANPQARANFIRQTIDFCEKYEFDGIDIDWEFPGFSGHNGCPEDTQNFTLLLKEMHAALKAHQPALLISIAAPSGSHYKDIELSAIHNYLDWINLMGYDLHGPWEEGAQRISNHHSALYAISEGDSESNVHSAVQTYLTAGVPAEKLILGMALYGRSYAGTKGLHCPYQGIGSGTTDEVGIRFFSDIKENLLKDAIRGWDDKALVPFLYIPEKSEFISYEDEESLKIKSEYIRHNQLAGAMVWEIGQDSRPRWNGLQAIFETLFYPQ